MPDRSAVRVISRRPAKAALTKTYATKAPPQFERSLGGFAAAFRWWLLAVAVALLAAFPAFAEAPSRVRGVVTAIDNGSITVEQRDLAIMGDDAFDTWPGLVWQLRVTYNVDPLLIS